jgi:hypothetical protein
MTIRSPWGSLAALLVIATAPTLAMASVKPAPVAPPTGADCDHLLGQFDVAWTSHRTSKRADAAHRARDLGEAACHEGRYADGVHQLKRALHDLGLKPVRRPQPAVAR